MSHLAALAAQEVVKGPELSGLVTAIAAFMRNKLKSLQAW